MSALPLTSKCTKPVGHIGRWHGNQKTRCPLADSVAADEAERRSDQERGLMGPLARLAAMETWARSEYEESIPQPLRHTLYGELQHFEMAHSTRDARRPGMDNQ